MTIDADTLIHQIRMSRVMAACVFASVLAEQRKYRLAEQQYDLADAIAREYGIAWEDVKPISS